MLCFMLGRPSLLDDTKSPDWVPSMRLEPHSIICVEPCGKKRKLSFSDSSSSHCCKSVYGQTDIGSKLMTDVSTQCNLDASGNEGHISVCHKGNNVYFNVVSIC